MDEYIGIVKIFAGTFAPRGWAFCMGQLVSIASNTPLFAILGTTYGGDGVSTFGLPDMRGRMAVGQGTGGGMKEVVIGEMAGSSSVSILLSNLPAHNHAVTGTVRLPVNDSQANLDSPVDAYLAQSTASSFLGTPGTDFAGNMRVSLTTAVMGGSQPIDVTSPYLGMNYIICLEGIFPSRN